MVPLQFLDLDVKDVLNYYERWTGRRLIYSTQLVGPIRMFVSGPVPQSEAIKLVEMALNINGFYIVPTEDPKIWKVTGIGMNPKQVGIPFVDREEMLPAGEQMVMFLFKLNWADPTELAATIGQGTLVPNQSGATSVVPLPKAQALLVTENTNIIRTLIRIVRAIDVEPSEVVSEFVTLQHAQADEVAQGLEKLFEKQQQQGAIPGVPTPPKVQRTDPAGNPLPPGVAPTDGRVSLVINGGTGMSPTEDNIVVGKVRITADKRTNRIHIVSRPVNLKLIRALIKEYDAQVPLETPAVRPLRFRPVEEVIDAVVAAVKDPGEKDNASGGAASTRPAGAPGTAGQTQRPATQNQQGLAGRNNAGSFGSNASSGSGDSSSGSLGESLSTTERDTQPTTQQVGKSTIIADKRANSIIVVGPKDVTEKIFALIDKLDVRQEQVMIHCVIGELRLTGKEQFGLEYILRNGGVIPGATTTTTGTGTGTGTTTGTTTTSTTGPVGFDSNGQAVLNLNNLLTGTSGNSVTQAAAIGAGGFNGIVAAGTAFNAVLKTLESSNRFRVVTRPSIFTSNNKRAIITSGEEIPVPANIQSSVNGNVANNLNNGAFVTNSSIQFKPVEIRLEVLPLINSNKEVSLEIVQNVSDVSGTTRIDGNDIINVSRRALKTYVTVPNNGTLILGGLIKDSKDFSSSGPLGLSKLPLIGPLFGSRTTNKVRTELIVLMRPVVTSGLGETASLREKTFQSFNIPPDLESAIMPQGIREQIKSPKPSSLRSPAPKLREESSGQRRQ